jgi:hypothetical protein
MLMASARCCNGSKRLLSSFERKQKDVVNESSSVGVVSSSVEYDRLFLTVCICH